MLSASAVASLAGGRAVAVSAWRDAHEGAIADLLTLAGICRVEVRPRADTLSIRHVNLSAGELVSQPSREVRTIELRAEHWDGPRLQGGAHHTSFRIKTSDRIVDVSVVIGVCRMLDEGIVRLSAQAIMRDAHA